jgi:capsular polysaccharide biosynthesis protein
MTAAKGDVWNEDWSLAGPPPEDQRLLKAFSECSVPRNFSMSVEELGNARVFGPDASVMDSEGRLVEEYSKVVGQPISAHRLLRTLRLPPETRATGSLAVLNVHRSDNYYHWLFEVLPRLHALQSRKEKPDFYYITARTQFQRDSLRLAGLMEQQILDPALRPHVVAERLLVPSRTPLGFPTPRSIAFLRELAAKVSVESLPRSKRIYVSRQRAGRRRLFNPEPVEAILTEYGFRTIYCEELSFHEQTAIFAQAEVVAGIHGAGLANLAFCQPGTRVIEFFAPDWINLCYRSLALAGGLNYACLVGEGGGNGPLGQGAHGRSSITLGTDSLLRAMKEI